MTDASSAERAAVVAWLRKQAAKARAGNTRRVNNLRDMGDTFITAAVLIERGDHLTPDPQEHLARRGR